VDIWKLPKKSDPSYKRKRELLLWYADELIPYCVGHDQWEPNIKKFHTMVSTITINEKPKPRVTAKGEGMARTIYANCIKKWNLVVAKQLANSEWKIPKYKKLEVDTHQYYNTLWSDCKSGKVEMGGWRPEAFTAFNEYTADILKFRKADHMAKWKMYKFAKKILRAKHGETGSKYTGKRKRKTSGEPTEGKSSTSETNWPVFGDANTYCFHQSSSTRTLWRLMRSTVSKVKTPRAKFRRKRRRKRMMKQQLETRTELCPPNP
jgi:hypothetical protein